MYGDVELELCYACGLKNSECHSCTAGAGSDHDRMGTKHDVHVYSSIIGTWEQVDLNQSKAIQQT